MLSFTKKYISALWVLKRSIHSQDWFPEQWRNSCVGLMLKKVLILAFLVSWSFFSEKHFINYTTILVSFHLGGCVDEVVNSHANYQGYWYDVHFLRCHTFAVIHSVNGEGLFRLSLELLLMCTVNDINVSYIL